MDRPIARSAFLRLAAGLTGVSGLMQSALAADYPAPPVRLLVGQVAGSGSDIFSRLIGLVVGPHGWLGRVLDNVDRDQLTTKENRPELPAGICIFG
jgi:hypothetical protein